MSNCKVFIDATALILEEHAIKLIDYLCLKCNKISFSILLNKYYKITLEEYNNAIKDFTNEYEKEDLLRRKKFVDDIKYRTQISGTYINEVEVFEYFNRLKEYDDMELNKVKQDLKYYINGNFDNIDMENPVNKKAYLILPSDNYESSQFTMYSHCTIGGLYKVYLFKLDNKMLQYFLNKKNLFDFSIFNNIMLDDPGFYKDEFILCSICSHERTTVLFLNEEQYKEFQELKIPHSIQI